MSYIIYIADCETTGIDSLEHDVVEFSAGRLTLDNPDKWDQKTWCIKALNASSITDKALSINKHKREDITHMTKFGRENYLEPTRVISEIEAWVSEDDVSIDNRVLCGQNIEFDYEMLRSLWSKVNSPDTFPFPRFLIDTIALARLIDICTGKQRGRYNLGSLVKDFGVVKRASHRADSDVEMTKDLFLKQILPLVKSIIDAHSNNYKS